MPHIKLIYFSLRGRAEGIRLILAAANVPYDDVHIEVADWPTYKNTTPFGQLPVLEIDGQKRIAQANAIARYLAHEYGLAGATNLENAQLDMLVDGLQDARSAVAALSAATRAGDVEKANAAWKVYRDETVLPFFRRYTGFLKTGSSGWFVGKSMTWADILIADFVEKQTMKEASILTDFPELQKHMERVYQNPGIAKWIATRPKWTW